VLGGAIAPIVATLLVASTGSLGAVAGYVAVASLVSLVAVLTLRSPYALPRTVERPVGPVGDAVPDRAGA